MSNRKVVLVDGVRTPFCRISSEYADLRSYDLARLALKGLKERLELEQNPPDQVILGTVISNVATSNVARDAMLGAGFAVSTPAYTVTQACISSNRAITNACDQIMTGHAETVVAGGVEVMSDTPIGFSKAFRKRLMALPKAKGPADFLKIFKGFRLSELKPQQPAVAEFSTGLTMGEDADQLAAEFGISREEQDAYAMRSHQLAAKAWAEGWLAGEVLPVTPPPHFRVVAQDNTFRADTSMEKLAGLKPVFVKPHGTVTAGNASPLTDGASAVALMSAGQAQRKGYRPLARIVDYVYTGQNPRGELLLGPAYAIPALLARHKLQLSDVDVFELHEAFAGQVLANLAALQSQKFARERLGLEQAVGEIPMDKLNTGGGSLSLGHPFGATGARLVTTAAHRLHREDGQFALVAACAAGGLGSAILIERI